MDQELRFLHLAGRDFSFGNHLGFNPVASMGRGSRLRLSGYCHRHARLLAASHGHDSRGFFRFHDYQINGQLLDRNPVRVLSTRPMQIEINGCKIFLAAEFCWQMFF